MRGKQSCREGERAGERVIERAEENRAGEKEGIYAERDTDGRQRETQIWRQSR